MNKNPEFIVYTGPMFGAKTSKLLSVLEKFKYQHKKVAVFKPAMDDRYSSGEIVTHGGLRLPAVCVKSGADVLEHLANSTENPQVVAVDEAFMIPGIAEALIWLYQSGFTVVVSSLEMSATAKPFLEIERMLVWATHVEKCTAVCTACGQDAHYTHKKQTNDEEIEIGGSELYEPRCFSHHLFINKRENLHE
jgi:thymidine kinase